MNAKRHAASLLLGVLLAACASTPATPTPAGSLTPTAVPGPTDNPSPTASPTDNPATSAVAIAAGSWHTCAVMGDGGVKCWGSNAGKLGDGTTTAAGVPVDVRGLGSSVKAITAGEDFTCALTDGGGVKCWGSNEYGELGDGSTDDSDTPVDVSGLASGVSSIAAGYSHTCALTAAGGVKCWGYNYSDYDERGDGTTIDSAIPVDVPGLLSDVVATAEGDSCELTINGGVKCSGDNESGQLGNGTTIDSSAPVGVVGLATGVKAITSGDSHACALMKDGGVKCWGSNEAGQLGNTLVAESSVPVAVDFPSRGPTLDASGAIVHATGPTDVVLRYDHGPDRGDLGGDHFGAGGPFAPGPEFTLYGDGTIIFRDETASAVPTKGGITRASPFEVGRLTETQIQSLLRFALEEGGLGIALPSYDNGGEGCEDGSWTHTLRAGGVDKRVESGGCGDIFELLAQHLRSVAAGSASEVMVPGTYWGSLLKASPLIKQDVLPKVPAAGAIPWPWPDIAPEAFTWHEDPELGQEGRREMSADEAAVLGLSDNGGVVQRAYLLGPDGKTVYSFSLWPRLPDETS